MTDKTPPAGHSISPGGAAGDHSLSDAVGELHKQHPHKWNDLGPHHGGDDHKRFSGVSSNTYKGRKG